MKTKRVLSLAISTIMLFSLTLSGCSSNKSESSSTKKASSDNTTKTPANKKGNSTSSKAEIILKYGDVNPDGHILLTSAKFFSDKVSELSSGRIAIDIYPSGQLGDDNEVYQAMQMGAVDLYRGNASSLTDFGKPQVSALALPYIFRDRAHFWSVCGGEVGREILDNIQKSNSRMVGLFYMDEGARNFFTVKKPVTKLEDMKGLKIRVQNSQMMLDTIAALGASPTPIAYAELYTALQTGVVDGAENPPASYFSNKFYEVAPYYVLDGHTYSPSVVLCSEITWKKLKPEDQQILIKAGKLTEEFNRNSIEEADQQAYKDLKAKGVTINTIEDKKAWEDAMASVYKKHGAEFLSLIEKIKNVK